MLDDANADIPTRDMPQWVRLRVDAGWWPYILTFQFRQMPGGALAIQRQQARDVGLAYSRLLTRIYRCPNSAAHRYTLPIFIAAPDLPVYKRDKRSKSRLRDVAVNGGQHVQGLFLLPPGPNRLPEELARYVEHNQQVLLPPGHMLRLRADRVLYSADEVMRYCLKSILSRRFDEDTLIILPRAFSEVRSVTPGR